MIKKFRKWLSENRESLYCTVFDVARIAAVLAAVWWSKNYIMNIAVLTVWLEGITGLILVCVIQPEDLLQIPKWRLRVSIICDIILCGLLAGLGWLVTSAVFGVETCLATAKCIKAHRDFDKTNATWLAIHNSITKDLRNGDSPDD